MGLPKLKSDGKEQGSVPKHSLKKRLRAWWEGYELRPLPEEAANAAGGAADSAGADTGEVAGEAVPEWSPARQKLLSLVWGEGFVTPVTPDHVVDLVQPFGLTDENTMLEIGSGPGGGACAVGEKIGSYVDGFDLSADLAKEALAASMLKGLEKKVVVKAFDPASFELKKDFYDGCLLREVLICIDDKEAFLEIVLGAVKPGKPIVLTENFLTAEEAGPLAQTSLDGEPGEVFACSIDRIVKKLEASNFEIHVNANETEEYTGKARTAWQELAQRITGEDLDDDLAAALIRETELWERRHQAYDAGELAMTRIVAFKKSEVS